MNLGLAHIALGLALSFNAWAKLQEVELLKATIELSLKAQKSGNGDLYVPRIKEQYMALARNEVAKDDLREVKYMYLHWAEHTAQYLSRKAAAATSEKEFNQTVTRFGELGSLIKPEEIETLITATKRVAATAETKENVALVLADYGDPHHARPFVEGLASARAIKRMGPPPMKSIRPYKGARKNKDSIWLDEPGMDQYEFIGTDEVKFRGLTLRSGDVMVTDLAIPHDGLLGGFLTDSEMYSHTAMFLVYRHKGKLIPAILEIHEKGKRLVPLSRWMNPDYTWATRVMRPPGLPRDFGERASKAYDGLETIHYDFQARPIPKGGELPEDQKCATCVTLPRIIYERAGISLPYPTTSMHPGAMPNLERLGLGNVKEYYSPTDVFTRSGFEQVGAVDNRQLYSNLLREIIVGSADVPMSLTYPMSHGVIHPERLPMIQHMEIWAAQQNGLVGRTARLIGGFQKDEMPMSAGPKAIGFYLDAGRLTDHVFEDMKQCPHLSRAVADSNTPLSVRKLERSQPIRQRVQDSIDANGAGKWFDMK